MPNLVLVFQFPKSDMTLRDYRFYTYDMMQSYPFDRFIFHHLSMAIIHGMIIIWLVRTQ